MIALNPIIVKELRSRMRGVRPYLVLTIFLTLLVVVSYLIYRAVLSQTRFGMIVLSAQVGQALLLGLALCEMAMVIFLAPGTCAGAISGEREGLTYDMLLATPLRPWQILSGKLLASLAYVFLLIFAAIPLFSLVLVFGGVAPKDMLKIIALLSVSAVLFGTLGIFCSALMRRTAQATILSYALVLTLLAGSWVAGWVWGMLFSMPGSATPPVFQYLNPLSALASINTININGPFVDAISWMNQTGSYGSTSLLTALVNGVTYFGPNGPQIIPVYRATLLFYPLLTLVLCWLSSHLVLNRQRWRPRRSDLVFAVLLSAGSLLSYLLRGWWLVWPPGL